ncbi:hypothetical protein [Roseivirga pacifica]|jgi:hypothetical protein|uniref:hypothetical protein n=1 Tax=Roseivirga pacifica TaxID=1267423 RepID=UPI0020957A0F|nr:hypothetical protein [Roseivirga pacifica]MCO6361004.1 hypothetical protein [Roseivirga pacifica]MCO6368893.1 hypothetical protein [Roseivirga pacifica]MCO6373036.1 hypothetical protein [Roseivirga pacifica]MCO6373116.1 hypothetical protein [Roseivirga pacifica]MCO6377627.1 hypothetical protein [Roseivirga pacifica]
MANSKTDPLFELIKSLNKTEKRHFRLFAKRSGSTDDVKFIKLFDAMESMKTYDDQAILKKVKSIKKVQLSNQKANLYKQILASLRQYHIGQNIDIQLREQLDHAKVLYNKGFYKQALKMLDKTKSVAAQNKHFTIALEVMEFEKLIESQYITRSIENRAEELTNAVQETIEIVSSAHKLSNLTLNLYSLYLKKGYAQDESDFQRIRAYFKENLPELNWDNLTFYERLYFHQAHVWYNKILQDFPSVYKHALAWVELFKQNPEMVQKQQVHFIKGYSNLLDALFQLQYYTKFCEVLAEVETLSKDKNIVTDLNTEVLIFKFLYISKINKYFMEGNFKQGVKLIPEILDKLELYKEQIDPERVLMMYYKFASLYFGNADYRKTIFYLNKIIYFKDVKLREDIHCFARILSLIAHFEDGQDYQLEYQIKSTFQFIGKMNEQQQVQKEIFQFLRKSGKITPDELKSEFKGLYNRLERLNEDPSERRPFLYLDILSYLKSRIENRPVDEVVQEKFRTLK